MTTNEKGRPVHTSEMVRMGGSRVCLGMQRLSVGTGDEEEFLWRFRVHDAYAAKPLIDVDATADVLLAVREFAEHALRILVSDGGRLLQPEAASADAIIERRPGESLEEAVKRFRGTPFRVPPS